MGEAPSNVPDPSQQSGAWSIGPIVSGTGLRLSASIGLVASSAERGPSGAQVVRESYGPEELAIVLSHYDVGVIQALQEFRRGSRRAPKLIISSTEGAFLLKRRAPGRDDLERVAMAHAVQEHLAKRQFPVPALLRRRDTHATFVRIGGRIYEMFEFIPGTKYDASLPATTEAGRALALFHKILADFRTDETHFAASYHGARQVGEQLVVIGEKLNNTETCAALAALYERAAANANREGLAGWPRQIVHGDWHPGNTLFRGTRVVAVIDFDGVRPEPRALDVANGALQFSILMTGQELNDWPEYLDESRFKRFCRGYDSVEGCVLSTPEVRALPWLMIEALIVEAVAPIAAAGQFAGFDGAAFLSMVRRKTEWMEREAEKLVRLLLE
ncbi:MAG: phosphotransferase enzyme family protein [Phycisphaerales bacterium]